MRRTYSVSLVTRNGRRYAADVVATSPANAAWILAVSAGFTRYDIDAAQVDGLDINPVEAGWR